MFIVLSVTNGEGYSNPQVRILESFREAVEIYLRVVSNLLNLNNPYEMGSDYTGGEVIPGTYKTLFTSFDEDGDPVDNYAVHMFPIESGDCVEICCDYVDEIITYKAECPDEFDKPFYQVGEEDEETGTMTIKIYIK